MINFIALSNILNLIYSIIKDEKFNNNNIKIKKLTIFLYLKGLLKSVFLV